MGSSKNVTTRKRGNCLCYLWLQKQRRMQLLVEWAFSVQSGTITQSVFVPFSFKYIVFKVISSFLGLGCACCDCIWGGFGNDFLRNSGQSGNKVACTHFSAGRKYCLSQFLRFDYMSDKCICRNAWHKDKPAVDVLGPPHWSKTLKQPIIMLWQEHSPRFFFPTRMERECRCNTQ